MKSDEKMFSVGEIIKSKKFQREAPEGFAFNTRRASRDKNLKEQKTTRKVNKTKKNIGLAK